MSRSTYGNPRSASTPLRLREQDQLAQVVTGRLARDRRVAEGAEQVVAQREGLAGVPAVLAERGERRR